MEGKYIKFFGPSIFKVKIPTKIIENLNKYIDQVILDKKKQNELNHGEFLVGDVTQEFLLNPDFVKKVGWLDFLGKCTQAWIKKETNNRMY